MDPTRPNPYGYAPRGGYRPYRPNHFNRPPPPQPGMPYGNIPPQQPPPHFPNMKLGGGPVGYAQPPIRPPPMMAPPNPDMNFNFNNNKLNTLFVGAIAAGIPDDWIDQLLKACGNLIEWKRVKDQSGNPKGFGFATYQDPDSVLRALRILGGEENNKGIVLKAQDGSQTEKTLIVKADDNVRNYLNQYKSSRSTAVTDEKEIDEKSLEKVNSMIPYINSGKKIEDMKENEVTTTNPSESISSPSESTNNNENKESSIMDKLGQDLAFLREQATKSSSSSHNDHHRHHHERSHSTSTEKEDEDDHHRHRHRRHHHNDDDNDNENDSHRRRQRKKQEFVKGHTEQLSIEDYDMELEKEDEEAERRKQEKYQKEMEATFRQREKRFEQRESTKIDEYVHNIKKERDDQQRRAKDREYWSKRLEEWDDDIEMKNDDNEFYNDRSRWRKSRSHLKRREEERDEEDRRLNMDIDKSNEKENTPINSSELESSQQKSSDLTNSQSSTASPTALPSSPATPIKIKTMTPTKIKSTKISLGQLPTKRMGGNLGDDDDDEDGNGRKRRVLIPLDYSELKDEDTMMEDNNNNETTSEQQQQEDIPILTEEERNQKIKELISSIPSAEDQLWEWDIKWDVLNDELMDTKLQPFVSKKVLELVGTEEDELVTFILDAVRKQTSPVDLANELEMTLDEDALVFVMKLWRTIIFETERVARHL
ncbi:unnamed protein product [Cunninghamella blakesleeana]